MNRRGIVFLYGLFVLIIGIQSAAAQVFADIEAGVAFPGYNDVRIPSETGTLFSLSEETPSGPVPAIRIRAGYTIAGRHSISVLAAPLLVRGSGRIEDNVDFGGTVFSAGSDVESLYRFDSYRISWQWKFFDNDKLSLAAGLTGKLRSADISVMGDDGFSRRADLGLVPLINFRAQWKFIDQYSVLLDGDALWSPYGRAEDVLVAFQYHKDDDTDFRLGYRVLEGGSDGGGNVYTFALFHYVTAGIRMRL